MASRNLATRRINPADDARRRLVEEPVTGFETFGETRSPLWPFTTV